MDNRAFVEKENLDAILQVGYTPQGSESLIENIFQGDIKKGKVKNELNGSDWQTTFEVGDGERKLVETKFNKSYAKGASITSLIKDVTASLNSPLSTFKDIKEKAFKQGITLSGGAKEIMDQLTKEAGVEWSLQDGEAIILSPTGNDGEEAFFISRNTGLIGSPVKREKGIELVIALNPKLRPGKRIQVESKYISGVYRIRKVVHDGDTHEGAWQSKVEAI